VLAVFVVLGAIVIWTVLKIQAAEELANSTIGGPAAQS
jgi:ACS family hexuronate transporter-like MFS transporter